MMITPSLTLDDHRSEEDEEDSGEEGGVGRREAVVWRAPDGSPVPPSVLERRYRQRLKQIGFGKSTEGYQNYLNLVPYEERDPSNPTDHPVTPPALEPCSKRSWDAQLRRWRRNLHRWDNNRVLLQITPNTHHPPRVIMMVIEAEGKTEVESSRSVAAAWVHHPYGY